MDWTGGVRRRFAPGKKKNSVLQKQKAHFAKARAALQDHGASRSPFAAHFYGSVLSTQARKRQLSLNSHEQDREHRKVASDASSPQWRDSPDHRHSRAYTHSVVYISSDRETASVSSSPRHITAVRPSLDQTAPKAQEQPPDMEEKLLLARRRNLLARSDWLGLAPLRPVQMKFASCSDRDRIGKRRKISKSGSRKAKPAEKHSMIQPFRRLDSRSNRSPRPYDVTVRIGTDALKSQTLCSRLSPVANNLSARPVSTEFGSLSEEPMLLDAEEDSHQPIWDPEGLISFDHRKDMPEPSSLDIIRGSQMVDDYDEMLANPPSTQMRQRLPSHADRPLERIALGCGRGHTNITPHVPDFEDSRRSDGVQANVRLYESPEQYRIAPEQTAANAGDGELLVAADPEGRSKDSESDDEELWRDILKIKHPPPSHHSLRALHSASAHIATSDSHVDHPELQQFIRALNPENGVIQPDLQSNIEELEQGITKAPSATQSPSTSFQQVETLARQKPIEEHQSNNEAEDEALWRQFIVGRADSDTDSEQGVDDARKNASIVAPTGHGTITAAPSLFNISGLGTSEEANMGESHSSAQNASPGRMLSHGSDLRFISAEYDARSRDSVTYDGRDVESIEDAQSPASPDRAALNIHTTSLRVLDPHRFKKPSRKRHESGLNANRFRLPRK